MLALTERKWYKLSNSKEGNLTVLQRIKRIFTTIAFSSLLITPMAMPVVAHAQDNTITNNLCAGVNLQTEPNATCAAGDDAAKTKIGGLLTTIINLFSLIVGFISVIMIIIGGLKYITSNGDSGNISSAKNTIIYALVGLAVVALAQFIVRFVLAKVSTT
jgi:cytochrome bd-type quinol oxidase subunit 2